MEEGWKNNRFKLRIVILLVMCLLNQNLGFCWSLNPEGLALLRFREHVVRDPFGALSNWGGNDGEIDPCSWFGVECSDEKVVVLSKSDIDVESNAIISLQLCHTCSTRRNLKDLCLGGTLAPELGNLTQIKSIILRNNSFSGIIPKEIGELKELEVLDLGYNNFCGPFPADLGNNLSLAILLLDNNKFLGSISPELHELKMLSEIQVYENQLTNAAQGASCNRISIAWNIAHARDVAYRRLLQVEDAPRPSEEKGHNNVTRLQAPSASASPPSTSSSPLPSPFSPSMSPSDSPLSPSPSQSPLSSSPSPSSIFLPPGPTPVPTPDLASPAPADPPTVVSGPPPSHSAPVSSPSASPSQSVGMSSHHKALILSAVIGASLFLLILVMGILFCRSNKVVTVKPWTTGLSGQLQKAFVTGVPKLKRSELETACEDFSNIIGSSPDATVYKGTLSSGVEIAVTSCAVASSKDWSKNLEAQFRKKIYTLSKVNHKNFVNLIGYCEEEERFTRMMVFEYAPNGTLFEHLHIQEAEHLNWGTRLRIAMGMAYCLEHMHQLTPQMTHKNLHSSSIYLTEDYAAKISDFGFWNEVTAAKMVSAGLELLDTPSADPESNVYSFGVILFEMITGRLPYSVDNGSLADWASDYLRGELLPRDMVDPTLKSFQEADLEKLYEVIRSCVHHDPKQRPTMGEVSARLREITTMGPDGATPKLSPLWKQKKLVCRLILLVSYVGKGMVLMATQRLIFVIPLLLILSMAFASANAYEAAEEKKVDVVVEGMVYCQSCEHVGTGSLTGAKPIPAKVSVICKDHKDQVSFYKVFATNGNGYFYAQLEGFKMNHYFLDHPLHSCNVELVSSPLPRCNLISKVNSGTNGSPLRYENKKLFGNKYEAVVYAAGPLAFHPAHCPPMAHK
ncbi:hypothetical protein HHK36_016142 [Tetracentron sinense]|uniref:Protein kinase domain-containing protein n=1 Tax=Tetracentron sinense TaxID=13715 RepID=A0A835DDY0_TETSI|nr:hypothetical protein HHK36_016142 [Tetracentron sinense]